jgi:hypothetical protein
MVCCLTIKYLLFPTWNKHGKDLILEEKNKAKLTSCIQQGYNVVLVLNKEEIVWH